MMSPIVPNPACRPGRRVQQRWRGRATCSCSAGTARSVERRADSAVLAELIGAERERLFLSGEPYNVPIRGHMTGGEHCDLAMDSGGMNEADFERFILE